MHLAGFNSVSKWFGVSCLAFLLIDCLCAAGQNRRSASYEIQTNPCVRTEAGN